MHPVQIAQAKMDLIRSAVGILDRAYLHDKASQIIEEIIPATYEILPPWRENETSPETPPVPEPARLTIAKHLEEKTGTNKLSNTFARTLLKTYQEFYNTTPAKDHTGSKPHGTYIYTESDRWLFDLTWHKLTKGKQK